MRFQKKLCVLAIASLFPVASALAQVNSDTRKEIDALKAQLKVLQERLEALSNATEPAPLVQQVNRLEQKIELQQTASEASGFSGLKVNGVIEAAYKYNEAERKYDFGASAGNGVGEFAMLQITKESQDGEGIDWTLRLMPGGTPQVHEASLSIPLNKENRIIAGVIPDFQGYEYVFPNANSTLGNQFISHNALYDLAGATSYTGVGMSHTMNGGKVALKWLVGNVDKEKDTKDALYTVVISPSSEAAEGISQTFAPWSDSKNSVALAYRVDYYPDESKYVGLSGLHGSGNRNFNIMAVDGGITRGDWQINGQITVGEMPRIAANGGTAQWNGVSGLIGYKIVPRLQLLARADYIQNSKNGGGTYVDYAGAGGNGLGPELDSSGLVVALDTDGVYATTGANLMRVTLGTNYQINANTQWKTEYRLDQSSGYNFLLDDGTYSKTKTSWGTSLVLSF